MQAYSIEKSVVFGFTDLKGNKSRFVYKLDRVGLYLSLYFFHGIPKDILHLTFGTF